MQININFRNENTNTQGKISLAKLREQLNIPTRLIAKRGDKILQDIASIENHDEITFTEPEMITFCVSLKVTIPEGSTVAELARLIVENLTRPEQFQAFSQGKTLNTNHRLGGESSIEFTDTKS